MRAETGIDRIKKERPSFQPDQPPEMIREQLNNPAFVQSLAETVVEIQMVIMPGHMHKIHCKDNDFFCRYPFKKSQTYLLRTPTEKTEAGIMTSSSPPSNRVLNFHR